MHVYMHKEQGEGGKSGGRNRKDVRKIFTEKLTASALGGGILGTFNFAFILQRIV